MERIVAEGRKGKKPEYTVKWVGWADCHNTKFSYAALMKEPGGRLAILAWQQRAAAIPTAAPKDRAAHHRYSGSRAPAPAVAPPPPIPVPAPVAPPLPPPPAAVPVVPPPPGRHLRSGSISRPPKP
eukprot:230538-Rhodomonas_salina.1